MNCKQCEEQLTDNVESVLLPSQKAEIDSHLRSCEVCSELLADIRQIVYWGRSFPVYEPPPWLSSRIVAATPRITRETWIDTLSGMLRWVLEPRTAMMIFTATLVLSWMGSLIGISPTSVVATVGDPATIYYQADALVNRVYAEAVRKYYSIPFLTEIQFQIEDFMENS